jgi:hypothetical protein
MRKILSMAVLVVAGLAALEILSSYFLFRYYAHGMKAIRPEGSAARMLFDGTMTRVTGKRPRPQFDIDHRPLFETNDVLGYVLRPGHYHVTERLGHQVHSFDLVVNDKALRAAAPFPVIADKRILIAGDSSLFGWGLNDEETVPWQIQARLPGYEVVNLSLTSYSTVHALLQLRQIEPHIHSEDVIVIGYHELSNKFNVEPSDVLGDLSQGYEVGLGDAARMRDMMLPFGSLDAHGKLSIQRIPLACASETAKPECARPKFDLRAAKEVTKRVFEEIIALQPGHLVIMFVQGPNDDEVISYLRSRGALIVDLRAGKDGVAFEDDIIPTDGHSGPFEQHQVAQRLLEVLREQQVVH